LESIAVLKRWQPTMTGNFDPELLEGQMVTASYFQVLGQSPVLGRNFDPSENRVNAERVVILSNKLWRRHFNGDPTIIGRQILLDESNYTVVGVMSPMFENVISQQGEVWAPIQYDMSQPRSWGHHLQIVARLLPGVSEKQARNDLSLIAESPIPEFARPPWAALKQGLIVNSLQDDITSSVKPALLAVLGAVLLVLIIACVNVTNLLLARGAQRRGEFAVRSALGAGRPRLIRQMLAESSLLAVVGGALGMAFAELGVAALVALSPPGLPRLDAIRVDGSVLAFGLIVTAFIGLAIGVVPAVYASGRDVQSELRHSSRRTSGGHLLTRRTLVVAEVALALVLLVSAGLLMRSLQRLFAINPGFDSSNMLTMQVQTSAARVDTDVINRFFAEALQAVREVPGVSGAAFTTQLPLSGDYNEYGVRFESESATDSDVGYPAFRYSVSPSYFETMGIPLRRGRLLDAHDRGDAPLAAVISESFARQLDVDPIGKRIHVGPTDRPWYTIVGVVGDVKQMSLAASQTDAVYVTPDQWPFADNALSLVVRSDPDAAALVAGVRKAVWSVDKDKPIGRVAMMSDLLSASAAERRFAMILFEAFGLVALVLAAAGIYGVLSGSVAERTNEIGVRLALGAQSLDILGLILRQGAALTLSGVGIGLLGSWAVTRLLAKLLYSISATDPVTFVGIALLLTLVALIACYIPAQRAARVDPLTALRVD